MSSYLIFVVVVPHRYVFFAESEHMLVRLSTCFISWNYWRDFDEIHYCRAVL